MARKPELVVTFPETAVTMPESRWCVLVIRNGGGHTALLLPLDEGEGMPAPRITMRKLTDILRLKHQAGLSHAKIAAALGLSKGVVAKYVCQVTPSLAH